MTGKAQVHHRGKIAILLLPLFVVALASTWLGLSAGTGLTAFRPDAPRFPFATAFNPEVAGTVDRYETGRDPAARPQPAAVRPLAAVEECEQVLANPGLDVVNNTIPSWSIIESRVYYTTDTYVSPPSAVVLPDGDADDPSPRQDAFAQVFTMPPVLTSVEIAFQTRTANANGIDKASGNLWTVDAGNNLDQFIGGWDVVDAAGSWAGRDALIADSDSLAEMAGQKMAIIFFTETDGQAPGEVVYFDDITLTACWGSTSTPTSTPTTTPSATPTATATGEPRPTGRLHLPAIFNPEQDQATPTPTASPGPTPTPSGDWTLETVPNDSHQGGWTSIALDASGQPHISFADITMKRIMYTRRTTAGWQTQAIDQLDSLVVAGPNSALALGSNNHPQIAYSYNNPVALRYVEWDGSNWNFLHYKGVYPRWVALALKQDGEPCLSYYEADTTPGSNTAKIKLICRTNGEWPKTAEVGVPTLYGISQYETSFHALAIDSQNRRHLSYPHLGNSNYNLYYARETSSGTWERTQVDGNGRAGFYSSLALDKQGRAHISYYDVTNGDLKYARWDGSQWRVETVDSTGDVGKYTSIEVDGSGRAHISYYDVSNQNLKYAQWDGTQWRIGSVDSEGEVGEYTSLALDAASQAHISYYDRTHGDVKYATNASVRR